MNKTDPRVSKTLRQIDEALLSLLEEHPFRDVTVAMLCQTAMINKTTFYKYYQDKYDCLNRYLNRLLEEFRQEQDMSFVLAPADRVGEPEYQEGYLRMVKYLLGHKREYSILWNARIDRPFFHEMDEMISEMIYATASAGRRLTPGQAAKLELYSGVFSGHALHMCRWLFQHEGEISEQDVMRIMTGDLSNGIFRTFKEQV